MSDTTIPAGSGSIETRADLDDGDVGVYQYWISQERIAAKDSDRWTERSRKIIQRYRDERDSQYTTAHKFNILWSNVQTLLPTLYARTPKPEVIRRFNDQDDVGRLAATLLERAISYSIDPAGGSPFDSMMAAVTLDRLLPGRGTARVLYVPTYGDDLDDKFEDAQDASSIVDSPGDAGKPEAVEADDEGETPDPAPQPLQEVVGERVIGRYVFWEDYAEGPSRTWEEVPWVRYRAYMTRDELIERFGRKKGDKISLDFPKGGDRDSNSKEEPPPDIYKKAIIHEYWDKANRCVVWIAPGTPDMVLDKVDDPLELPDFYPSPDPLLATTTTDRRIPVPDYLEYQDQAQELDLLTARIDVLTKALRVVGVYPGAEKQMLQQLVSGGMENKLVPVEDWVAFSDKGGLANFIQYLPIKDIASTLMQLYDARDRVKSILYEITGIGDILRGETVPNETATAQQLKSNFATRRIVPQQKAVARFARDIVRLMGSVIAGHFSAQTISQITGYPMLAPVPALPPPPQMFVPDPAAQQMPPMGAPGNVVPMRPPGPPMMGRVA